ncbi:MAG: c-type cytochrome [Oligoflexales bacterium]
MSKRWKLGVQSVGLSALMVGCIDQYNPRPYWAQWKAERHIAHRVMPKLKAGGVLPDMLEPMKHKDVSIVSATREHMPPIRLLAGELDVKPKMDPKTGQPSGGAGSDGIPAEIATAYQTNCQMCHGEDGKGVAGMGARNFTDVAWQDSTNDDRIIEVITKGGAAVGLKPTMPPWAHLGENVIKGLMKKVRSFKSS